MKKAILFAFSCFFLINCRAQSFVVKDLSSEESLNYVLANIEKVDFRFHGLYDKSFFVSVYTISDSKVTPAGFFEGYDSVLSSVLISIVPDGDYYTDSKLYKIEGFLAPKVLAIEETIYPEIVLSIEQGKVKSREISKYKLLFKER